MKIVYNNIIPFPGYKAINLFGVLFVRKGATIKETDMNHEAIHTAQIRETLYIFFYMWYVFEWVFKLFMYCDAHKAYRNIGFEKEAYKFQEDGSYLEKRKHYKWFTLI